MYQRAHGPHPVAHRMHGMSLVGDPWSAVHESTAPVVLVMGTSGTTMTGQMIAAMLGASGLRATYGLEAAARARLGPNDRIVLTADPGRVPAEVAAAVMALTGLRTDELPEGVTRQAFAAGVKSVMSRVTGAVAVNADDALALGLAATAHVPVHATGQPDPSPLVADRGGRAVITDPATGARRVLSYDELPVASPYYRRNAYVAITAALLAGARPESVAAIAQATGGRGLDRLGTRRGLDWLVDAEATRPGRVLPAMTSVEGGVLLIAGGVDGGQPLGRWAWSVDGARYVLLYGPAAGRMARAARGRTTVVRCADLDDAVLSARRLATRGDTIVFSPGCLPERGSPEEAARRFAELSGVGRSHFEAA